MSLTNLTSDLFYNLATYLDCKADVLPLALSSKYLFSSLCPLLYSDVHLVNMEQCLSTLTMLKNRPYIARHIRKLFVHLSTGFMVHSTDHNAYDVSCLVSCLAHTLDALHTFIWDVDGIRQCEDMWLVLQMSCPRLTTIGIACTELPDIHSNIFRFEDLRGFNLDVKRCRRERCTDAGPQEFRAELDKLWDMLIRRSPDLEELHVSGVRVSFDSCPLCYARWPKLHSLSISDILPDVDRNLVLKRPFTSFLEAHPRLRSLRLPRAGLDPSLLSSLSPDALPELTRFSGGIEHLQGLPHIHQRITSVALDEPLVIHDHVPSILNSVLRGLTSLTELRVCVVFQSAHQGGNLSRFIVHSCPLLTKLDLVFTPQSSFNIDTLARVLRPLSFLRHLRITLVRAQDEAPLPVCASTIVHSLPRLHSFSITFIPPNLTLPLHSNSEIGCTTGVPGHPYIESGNYVIQMDEHGSPISVACTERRTSASSLLSSLVSSVSQSTNVNRRIKKNTYTLALRPEVRARSGLGLVLEQNQAGDQARAVAALAALMGLVSWGLYLS